MVIQYLGLIIMAFSFSNLCRVLAFYLKQTYFKPLSFEITIFTLVWGQTGLSKQCRPNSAKLRLCVTNGVHFQSNHLPLTIVVGVILIKCVKLSRKLSLLLSGFYHSSTNQIGLPYLA